MSSIRLPSDLYDTYALYKAGTTALVKWLLACSGNGERRAHVETARELTYLTKLILKKNIKVPYDLLRTVRRTIRARTRVANYFKKLGASKDHSTTASHEYFTNTLQQVYDDLRERAEVIREDLPLVEDEPTRSSNTFEHLLAEYCSGDDDDNTSHEECERNIPSVTCKRRSRKVPKAGNDYVNEFMALSTYLLELDRLGAIIKQSWEDSAAGIIPVVVAATTANVAYQMARNLEHNLHEYGIHNPDEFSSRYTSCIESLNLENHSPTSPCLQRPPPFTLFSDEKGPQQGWRALERFREFWQRDTGTACAELQTFSGRRGDLDTTLGRIAMDDPEEFFHLFSDETSQNEPQARKDQACMDLILKRMGQLLIRDRSDNQFCIPFRTPLLDELGGFLGIKEKILDVGVLAGYPCVTAMEPLALSLSFGLQMLVESYKSFTILTKNESHDGQEHAARKVRKSCRVQSLQFATDVGFGISHVMAGKNPPCECLYIGTSSVARLLSNSRVFLRRFVNEIRFDIFYQAPWTSGQHMTEHLSNASDAGAKAWHHGYIMGTLLYIYHCLILLEVITPDQVPVLEHLCHLFEGSVFLGQRPRRNLFSCYERWSGGSIDFSKGHCKALDNHDHPRGSRDKKWSLKIKRDFSKGGNHPIRGFNPAKISLFSLLAETNYVLDDNVLAWIYCSKTLRKATPKDAQEARKKAAAELSRVRIVELIRAKILEEFQGDFPVAKINYFAIYETCAETLAEINRSEHVECSRDPYVICSCLTERLLQGTDEYMDDSHIVKIFPQKALLENCKRAILELAGSSPLSDFQWRL